MKESVVVSLRSYLAELGTQQVLQGNDDEMGINELYSRSSKSRAILRLFLFLTNSSSDLPPVLRSHPEHEVFVEQWLFALGGSKAQAGFLGTGKDIAGCHIEGFGKCQRVLSLGQYATPLY
jgi:hypothetical protein